MKKNKLVTKNKAFNNSVLESYTFSNIDNYPKLENGNYELDSAVLLKSRKYNLPDEIIQVLALKAHERKIARDEKLRIKSEKHEARQELKVQKIKEFADKKDALFEQKQFDLADHTALVKEQKTKKIDAKIKVLNDKIEVIKKASSQELEGLFDAKKEILAYIDPQLLDSGVNVDDIDKSKYDKNHQKRFKALDKYSKKINKAILNRNVAINSLESKIAVLDEQKYQILSQPVYFSPLKRIFFNKNIGMLLKAKSLDDDRRNEVRTEIISNFNGVHDALTNNEDKIKEVKNRYKLKETNHKIDYLRSVGKFNSASEAKLNKELNKFYKKPTKRHVLFTEKVYSFLVKMQDRVIRINKMLKNVFANTYKQTEYVETENNSTICYDYKGRIKYLQTDSVGNFKEVNSLVDGTVGRVQDTHYTNVKKRNDKRSNLIINNALYVLVLAYFILVSIVSPSFIKPNSLYNIINQLAFYLPIALGVGGIIVLTGTDLSAGRIMGLTALILFSLQQNRSKIFPHLGNFPFIVALILILVIGGVLGAINGYFTAKFKIHPFIVTLATALVVWGIMILYTKQGTNNGAGLFGLKDIVFTINKTKIFGSGLFLYDIYVLLLLIFTYILWNKTKFGKNMFAVGSNPDAATVSGISVFKTTMLVFIFAGITYGFQGFLATTYTGSVNSNTGTGFELDAITACVVGGVSFTGGVGKIRGIITGTLIIVIFNASILPLGINPATVYIIKGLLILVATTIDMRKYIVKK